MKQDIDKKLFSDGGHFENDIKICVSWFVCLADILK